MTIKGIDEFRKKLNKLQNNANRLNGTRKVSFPELFNSIFMGKHTDHASIEALIEASGYKVESAEDFKAIPDADWDDFIRKATRFSSWEQMQKTAAEEYFARELMAGISG